MEFSTLFLFLASQDPLEVMSVSRWVTLRTELTDVTLVSEDTYWGLFDVTLAIGDTYGDYVRGNDGGAGYGGWQGGAT